jgi:hypothetical protein
LKDIVGNDNVSNTAAVREQHSHDESYHTYALYNGYMMIIIMLVYL